MSSSWMSPRGPPVQGRAWHWRGVSQSTSYHSRRPSQSSPRTTDISQRLPCSTQTSSGLHTQVHLAPLPAAQGSGGAHLQFLYTVKDGVFPPRIHYGLDVAEKCATPPAILTEARAVAARLRERTEGREEDRVEKATDKVRRYRELIRRLLMLKESRMGDEGIRRELIRIRQEHYSGEERLGGEGQREAEGMKDDRARGMGGIGKGEGRVDGVGVGEENVQMEGKYDDVRGPSLGGSVTVEDGALSMAVGMDLEAVQVEREEDQGGGRPLDILTILQSSLPPSSPSVPPLPSRHPS